MHDASSALPAFVERAREDAECRAALARAGYSRVKTDYAQQVRDGAVSGTFRGLERENLAPPMDMVRDWLREERKRTIGPLRWTFLGAMAGTIIVGLALAAVLSILG